MRVCFHFRPHCSTFPFLAAFCLLEYANEASSSRMRATVLIPIRSEYADVLCDSATGLSRLSAHVVAEGHKQIEIRERGRLGPLALLLPMPSFLSCAATSIYLSHPEREVAFEPWQHFLSSQGDPRRNVGCADPVRPRSPWMPGCGSASVRASVHQLGHSLAGTIGMSELALLAVLF